MEQPAACLRQKAVEHMFEQVKQLEPHMVQTLQSLVEHLTGIQVGSSQSKIRELESEVFHFKVQLADKEGEIMCMQNLIEDMGGLQETLVARENELATAQMHIQVLQNLLVRKENEHTFLAPLQSRVDRLECMLLEKESQIQDLEKRLNLQPQVDGEVWQFQGDSGEWISFPDSSSKELMRKFKSGHQTCQIVIDGRTYDINFSEGRQMNYRSGKERKIRCFFDLPPHWNMTDEDALNVLKVAGTNFVQSMQKMTDKKMMLRLEQVLNQSLTRHDGTRCDCPHGSSEFIVIEAYEVKNLHLWRRYQRFVRTIRDKHKQHGICPDNITPALGEALTAFAADIDIDLTGNERLLLHGTHDFEVAKVIAVEGFDNRVANDGLYGTGTYFAAQTCKSAQYATEAGNQKASFEMPGTILFARVALGDPYYTEGRCDDLCRPPEKQGVLADSIIARPGIANGQNGGKFGGKGKKGGAGVQSHMEFVTFDPAQVYPDFIVRFIER